MRDHVTCDRAAELVLTQTLERPPTLGDGRLVCVDGPAGSGKTTLAEAVARLAARHGTVRVLHMDDLYEGWQGLGDVGARVAEQVVGPLSAGLAGRYRRYDWELGRFAEWHTVEPVGLLVLEGVGSGARRYDASITTLVWVDAPPELRLRRGLDRDGEALRDLWLAWMRSETAVFAEEDTRRRAHVHVDWTGEGAASVIFQ